MHSDASDTLAGTRRHDRPTGVLPVDVVVATRPALVRDVMARALGARLGLGVIAVDTDAGEGFTDRIRKLQPRIIIIDGDDSISTREVVIRRLHRASPSTRIIVLMARCDEDRLRLLALAGVYTVVQESSDLGTLVRAVESAYAGRESDFRFDVKSSNVIRGKVVAPDGDRRLTTREWEVAELVATGLRNKVIARRLNITVDTVKSHLNNSFRKLGLDGRLALGILARRRLGSKEM
jgi:DNA-binding NarL/FixJ family response regulator